MTAAPGLDREAEEDEILDRVACRCGGLAAVVVVVEADGAVICAIRCPCQAFSPADTEEGGRP